MTDKMTARSPKVKSKRAVGQGTTSASVSFEEDGNVVEMHAEGMESEFMSEGNESDDDEVDIGGAPLLKLLKGREKEP